MHAPVVLVFRCVSSALIGVVPLRSVLMSQCDFQCFLLKVLFTFQSRGVLNMFNCFYVCYPNFILIYRDWFLMKVSPHVNVIFCTCACTVYHHCLYMYVTVYPSTVWLFDLLFTHSSYFPGHLKAIPRFK